MTFRELLTKLQDFARHNPDHQALDEHVVVRLQTNDDNGDELHVGGLRVVTMDAGCTETVVLTLDADQDSDEPDDDPIANALHRLLANRTGKLRVSDAYRFCGMESEKNERDCLARFHRAISNLGWERQHRRFNGALQYAYVRGTPKEREVEIIINGEEPLMKAAL